MSPTHELLHWLRAVFLEDLGKTLSSFLPFSSPSCWCHPCSLLRVTLHCLATVLCQLPSELVPKAGGISACREEAEWEG